MNFDTISLNEDNIIITKYNDVICKKNIWIAYSLKNKEKIKETEIPTDYYDKSFIINEGLVHYPPHHEDTIMLDNAFVCLYQWCYNYQHFLTECLPKVFGFLHLKKTISSIKIVIPNISWIEDFFNIFCQKEDIVKNSCDIVIKNSYFASDKNRNLLYLNSYFYLAMKCISLHYNFDLNENKSVYFKRINSDFNVINGRNIKNNIAFENFLNSKNIDILSFENMDIYNKLKNLSNINKSIFIYGASMMNFCFCKKYIKLIIINHPGFFVDTKWLNILYKNNSIEYKVYNVADINMLNINSNEEIFIDIKDFEKYLSINKFA